MQTLKIAIPNTKRDYFDYLLPKEMEQPLVGARVQVPFRHNTRIGIMLGTGESELSADKLKPILEVIDTHVFLPQHLLKLCQWMANYYHAPLSDVLTLALPKRYREGKPLIEEAPDALDENAVLQSPLTLNPEQASALYLLTEALGRFQPFVLDGVTGSGKTEVYLQLATQVIARGEQVLVLVPEIGLTPQLVKRFQSRFNTPIVAIHSHLTDKGRAKAWAHAATHQVQLVIGTRTALFTPMPKLGLIIIDEEHDASFKQQEGIRYSARDAALVRAHQANIPIILGSATPSLESLHNCKINKYTHLLLTQKAENQTPLFYRLIDLRAQKLKHGIAPPTLQTIEKHLKAGHQILVFINRRGFAPVLLCHHCGWHADCKACDSHLTLHHKKNQMICHHCGYKKVVPKTCESCFSEDLLPIGHGTERVYNSLQKAFPDAGIARIDRDVITKNSDLTEALAQIESGQTQILIGTQMLAKGHHFPNLTLVVILDADGGFYHQDFRALERLGQLITQVSGRAGRASIPGEVLIQTHFPDNPMLKQLIESGYHDFSKSLLTSRHSAALPPYHHIALLRASGRNEQAVYRFLEAIKKHILHAQIQVQALGPAPAPLARKATLFHMQLLLKAAKRADLHQALHFVQTHYPPHTRADGVRWVLDVDPVALS